MTSTTNSAGSGSLRMALGTGLACVLLTAASLAQAGKVVPPPLPPGSNLVRLQGGMNDDEARRQDRAHHHKGQNKKNLTVDDSDPANKGNGNGNGKNK
jgi:hypothetical protein